LLGGVSEPVVYRETTLILTTQFYQTWASATLSVSWYTIGPFKLNNYANFEILMICKKIWILSKYFRKLAKLTNLC
jgi:hypothetical protein